MQKQLWSKLIIMLVMLIGFLVVFTMMRGLVMERKSTQREVIQEIGRNHVRHQVMLAPFVAVPVQSSAPCKDPKQQGFTCTTQTLKVITPKTSDWQHQLTVSDDQYGHGIYRPITYQDQLSITGQFVPDTALLNPAANQQVLWDQAKLYLGLSDLRGLRQQPVLTVGQQKYVFDLPSDSEESILPMPYTRVAIGQLAKQAKIEMRIDLSFMGMESLAVQPVGKDLKMTVVANWAHASFFGGQLPEKNISSNAFSAVWQNTYLTNQNTQRLIHCISSSKEAACQDLVRYGNSVDELVYLSNQQDSPFYALRLVNPVDVYLQSERTLKYAVLFVVISFAAFFLFEILKNLRIHPIQYGLVGLGLAVFYLLLLSFSEQVAFVWAYIGSSAACVLLICWYVSYVLHSIGRALGLAVILGSMYATLYVILQSEDHALILGSVLVFVLIGVVMFLTRHVNWYAVGESEPQPPFPPSLPDQS